MCVTFPGALLNTIPKSIKFTQNVRFFRFSFSFLNVNADLTSLSFYITLFTSLQFLFSALSFFPRSSQPVFLLSSFSILCLEVTAKRASFSKKQKEGIDWVISCYSGGPFDQTWKTALHARIVLQQLFLSFTIITCHGHIQSFPFLSPYSLGVIPYSREHYYSSFSFLPPVHSAVRKKWALVPV